MRLHFLLLYHRLTVKKLMGMSMPRFAPECMSGSQILKDGIMSPPTVQQIPLGLGLWIWNKLGSIRPVHLQEADFASPHSDVLPSFPGSLSHALQLLLQWSHFIGGSRKAEAG